MFVNCSSSVWYVIVSGMGKSIFYRLFKLGRIPQDLQTVLEMEGIVVSDEGIGGWYVTKDLKSPGRRSKYRKEGFSGFLVITKTRVLAYTFKKRQVNIAVDDPNMSKLYAELVGSEKITLSFETSSFHDDWQGVIELQFNTPKAQDFYEALLDVGVQSGTVAEDNWLLNLWIVEWLNFCLVGWANNMNLPCGKRNFNVLLGKYQSNLMP